MRAAGTGCCGESARMWSEMGAGAAHRVGWDASLHAACVRRRRGKFHPYRCCLWSRDGCGCGRASDRSGRASGVGLNMRRARGSGAASRCPRSSRSYPRKTTPKWRSNCRTCILGLRSETSRISHPERPHRTPAPPHAPTGHRHHLSPFPR
jgi:hypothetical protein